MNRNHEITEKYMNYLDNHIRDIIEGNVLDFKEINEIARDLCVSHKHLIDILQQEKGKHPCYFYDLKIIEQAKKKLIETDLTVAEIASIFTYDASNFSKFFKKFTAKTPGKYRKEFRI